VPRSFGRLQAASHMAIAVADPLSAAYRLGTEAGAQVAIARHHTLSFALGGDAP
jgi:hypothetical protein